MTKAETIKRIVDRFLCWKLPENFRPDCGIEFDRDKYVRLNPINRPFEPVGTNLFDRTQATTMVEHIAGQEIDALTARIAELEADATRWREVAGELAGALGEAFQHGEIMTSERRMNRCGTALTRFKQENGQ